jgi:hypothetical protein
VFRLIVSYIIVLAFLRISPDPTLRDGSFLKATSITCCLFSLPDKKKQQDSKTADFAAHISLVNDGSACMCIVSIEIIENSQYKSQGLR